MSTNMNALPATPLPSLSEREARFAEHFAIFDDPAKAWHASGDVAPTTKRLSVQRAAYGYLARPHVRARVTEIRNRMAATGPDESKALLIRRLEEAAGVDIREIIDLTTHHCPSCYSSDAYRAGWPNATLAAATRGEPLPPDPMPVGAFDPDLDPWPRCGVCAGVGREVRRHTSFADLSPAARRVLRGIETHADGSIKRVLIADITQLELELHKVKGMHVDRSVSLNINADVKPLKRGMSVEEALTAMAALGVPAALPADQPDDSTVVSEQ
jgi:hypothetical protein